MTLESSQPVAPEASDKAVPQNLLTELSANLELEFKTKLAEAEGLPDAVSKSLCALLAMDGPTTTDVIAALTLEDSSQPEATNE